MINVLKTSLASSVVLALAVSAALAAGTGSASRGGFAGGVVGGTPKPTPDASTTKPAGASTKSSTVLADWVPTLKNLPIAMPDPIERPDFATKPHPITKSLTTATAMMVIIDPDGGEIGLTSDIIASVNPDSRKGATSMATFVDKQAKVGKEMTTSFDEAVRAVKVRYPYWEPGRIEFNFGEKYTGHDGGSAGTCFAVMLLSELEGFDIDPKAAITGDISVNWKVRKIGGTAAKVHGATEDGCLYTCVPPDNADEIADMYLMNGYESLRNIQIFTIPTLQDAVAVLRTDRAPRLTEAMQVFSDLVPHIKTKASLGSPDMQKALDVVLAYAPNHLSAKLLQEIGKNTAPTKLSLNTAVDEFFGTIDPYKQIIMEGAKPTRADITPQLTAATRKRLNLLRPILPQQLVPLAADVSGIVDAADQIAGSPNTPPTQLLQKRQSFEQHLESLSLDKDFKEKLLRN